MRVLHISCVAPPVGGGIGAVADLEVRMLRQKGVEAWLATPANKKNQNAEQEYIINLPMAWHFGNAGRLKGLDKLIKDADIVHLHYPFYGTANYLAKLKRQGKIKKLVLTLHMDAVSSGLKGLIFNLHRQFIQPGILAVADRLFVSSLDYARHSSFSSLANNHCHRLSKLPFGVNSDIFTLGDKQNKKFNIPSDAFVVGTVSVMDSAHPFKGVDILIHSAQHLPQNVHFLLVGEGNLRPAYERLVQDYNLSDRFHFTGRLSNQGIVQAYQTMDVFAFPSTSRAEAFGLALLEAMSCGVAPVASNLPGVRILAQDSGLLVEPGNVQQLKDALLEFVKNPNKLKRAQESARQKALTYAWDGHVKLLINYYQSLCAS